MGRGNEPYGTDRPRALLRSEVDSSHVLSKRRDQNKTAAACLNVVPESGRRGPSHRTVSITGPQINPL